MAPRLARGWAERAGPRRCCSATRARAGGGARRARSAARRSTRSPSSPSAPTPSLLAVKPAALRGRGRAARRRGRRDRSRCSPRRRVARLRELLPRRPGAAGDADDQPAEVRRGVICHAPLEPSRRRGRARGCSNLLGELGHLGRGPRRADRRGDRGDVLLARLPRARRPEPRRGRRAPRGSTPSSPTSSCVETLAGTIELLRRYDPIAVRGAVASRGGAPRPGSRRSPTRGVGDAFEAAVARLAGADARMSLVALTRGDIADYVDALVLRLLRPDPRSTSCSRGSSSSGRSPTTSPLRAVTGFIEESTNPYLNLFRRLGAADRPARHQPDRRDHRALRSSAGSSSA